MGVSTPLTRGRYDTFYLLKRWSKVKVTRIKVTRRHFLDTSHSIPLVVVINILPLKQSKFYTYKLICLINVGENVFQQEINISLPPIGAVTPQCGKGYNFRARSLFTATAGVV